ncbi:putative Loss [Hypsibius exemplaris]|uniref:BLOC-1-related complex subunit 5 n=1 Tax=Hypsibius exemplaris TaxID=2072580 RepID=A0A1W0X566_HYPEX|nr:putative Loss [Hypsibius exemplaris]
MGSDLSTQNSSLQQQQRDPPTPSTVRSFPEEVSGGIRNPPIDAGQRGPDAQRGRLSRFLSDAIPSSRGVSKLPIPAEIHVVREGNSEVPTIEMDPDMKHMLMLPSFLPLVRSSVNAPAARDPEVCDRLDYRKILMIGLRYQQYLRQCSDIVTVEQQSVVARVKEIEQTLVREVGALSEKQKLLARYAETFSSVADISKTLDKIDENLGKAVAQVEKLNQKLPPEYQMPPFS